MEASPYLLELDSVVSAMLVRPGIVVALPEGLVSSRTQGGG